MNASAKPTVAPGERAAIAEPDTRDAPRGYCPAMHLAALIFDFDGLVLDTEWSIYDAWQVEFRALGAELPLAQWMQVVGTSHSSFNPMVELARHSDAPLDHEVVEARVTARHHADIAALPAMPGVAKLVEAAKSAGCKVGAASSSPTWWVDQGLVGLGLRDAFDTVAGRDLVGGRSKPAPDVYELALLELGVKPSAAVALEDSAHGVAAARAAGLAVVAVPNRITSTMNFSAAQLRVPSLEGVELQDLADLLTKP